MYWYIFILSLCNHSYW